MRPALRTLCALLCFSALIAIGMLCQRKTKGFTCAKIRDNFALTPLECPPPDAEALAALRQPFHYYKRGAQSFVFISEDGKHVLKVFNNRLKVKLRLLRNLPHASPTPALLQQRLKTAFCSYHLSATRLRQESGVLFAHLSPNPQLTLPITLVDRLGIHHSISSQTTAFLLQKRADLVYPAIKRCMASSDPKGAEQIITSVIRLFDRCIEEGVINEDPSVRKNIGIDQDKCLILDVGRLQADERLKTDSEYAAKQKMRCIRNLRKWLARTYPELTAHFDRTVR